MRFEEAIEIDADPERVWAVLGDLEAWPRRIETVDQVEILTGMPVTEGSHVLLKQPKLPDGTWEITAWEPPSYFAWSQKTAGITSVARHRVEAVGSDRSRLTLTMEMRGLLAPIVGSFSRGLVTRYMSLEAKGMKLAAESTEP